MSQPIPISPIVFEPNFRSYLWGGRRLQTDLGKRIPSEGIWAESWEIVDHGADQSMIAPIETRDVPWYEAWIGKSLRDLIASDPVAVLGPNSTRESTLPLLLKYLDCQNVLSVQVHPEDQYALQMDQPDLGKTEAWYVIKAEHGAKLYAGLKRGVSEKEFRLAVSEHRIEETLNEYEPKIGDCIFIPAGTVHALGCGLIVAEIQQASDTTFRVYDWNRVGADGKPRQLHIEQAFEVIDFERGPVTPIERSPSSIPGCNLLVDCDRFTLLECRTNDRVVIDTRGQFALLTVPSGEASVAWEEADRIVDADSRSTHTQNALQTARSKRTLRLSTGQSALVPACLSNFEIQIAAQSTMLIALPPPAAEH